MSRHYNPNPSKDAARHPFNRTWRAVAEQGKSMISWLSSRLTTGLGLFLRPGTRPTAATVLDIQNAQPAVPTAGEIKRELRSVRLQTLDADLFPMAVDRYRMHLEDQLSAVRHRSAP